VWRYGGLEACFGPGDVEMFASRDLEVRCRRCLKRGITRGSIIHCAGLRNACSTCRNHRNHHKSDLIRSPLFWQSILHR